MNNISFKDIVGSKVLILGESGSGKTLLLAKLLEEASLLKLTDSISVLDFAPALHEGFGGKLADYCNLPQGVRYLAGHGIKPPRLAGKSRSEVLLVANHNMKIAKNLLKNFIDLPTETLLINDLSIYFHVGELADVLECTELASTFIATAYSGSRLDDDKGSGVTSRERRLLEELGKKMDRILRLPDPSLRKVATASEL